MSKDGKLMFGSNYGLVVITPGKIVNNSTVTPMAAFTNLRINGIAMRPGRCGFSVRPFVDLYR